MSHSFAVIDYSYYPQILILMVSEPRTNEIVRFILIPQPTKSLTQFEQNFILKSHSSEGSIPIQAKIGETQQVKVGELTVQLTIEEVRLDNSGRFEKVRIRFMAAFSDN